MKIYGKGMYNMKYDDIINMIIAGLSAIGIASHDAFNQYLYTVLLVLSITAVLIHMLKGKGYTKITRIEDPAGTVKDILLIMEEAKKVSKFKIVKAIMDYLNPKLNGNSQLAAIAQIVLAVIIANMFGIVNIAVIVNLGVTGQVIIVAICLLLGAKVTMFGFETSDQFLDRLINNGNKINNKKNKDSKGG